MEPTALRQAQDDAFNTLNITQSVMLSLYTHGRRLTTTPTLRSTLHNPSC